jgi:5-methyltetrahydropteroyltriglutamate--homocysteine methyltransferase
MKRSVDRILTTHVGSLVRTPEIIEAMITRANGKPVDEAEYAQKLRAGVADVVRRQAQAGVDVVSDGEYGKLGWIPYVSERFSGFKPLALPLEAYVSVMPEPERFGDFYRQYLAVECTLWLPDVPSKANYKGTMGLYACTEPVRYHVELLQRDIANFKAALQGVKVEEAFMPVVAPCSLEVFPNQYYKTEEEYLFALADALRAEYRTIVDAGFILQVDDAILPMRAYMMQVGKTMEEYHAWAQLRIEALNGALKGIPREKIRYHICWGSQNVPHTTDAPLAKIVDLILKVNAGAYLIEAANPRHEHEWQVWQNVKLPEGTVLVPGMICHSTNVVEHPELIAWRLENFARMLGRENIMAGTDCGFSQDWNLVRMHPQVQWAKLESLAEGARLASRKLWGRAAA